MKVSFCKTMSGKMFFDCDGRQSTMTRHHAVSILWFLTNACFSVQDMGSCLDLDLSSRQANLGLQGGGVFPTKETVGSFIEKRNRKKKVRRRP
jgi:hypothetical protein